MEMFGSAKALQTDVWLTRTDSFIESSTPKYGESWNQICCCCCCMCCMCCMCWMLLYCFPGALKSCLRASRFDSTSLLAGTRLEICNRINRKEPTGGIHGWGFLRGWLGMRCREVDPFPSRRSWCKEMGAFYLDGWGGWGDGHFMSFRPQWSQHGLDCRDGRKYVRLGSHPRHALFRHKPQNATSSIDNTYRRQEAQQPFTHQTTERWQQYRKQAQPTSPPSTPTQDIAMHTQETTRVQTNPASTCLTHVVVTLMCLCSERTFHARKGSFWQKKIVGPCQRLQMPMHLTKPSSHIVSINGLKLGRIWVDSFQQTCDFLDMLLVKEGLLLRGARPESGPTVDDVATKRNASNTNHLFWSWAPLHPQCRHGQIW